MKTKKMKMDEALEFVKQKRSCVCPNSGFMEQLKTYESKISEIL
jgi:hypothetical protein